MKIKTKHIAQFMLGYGIIAFFGCIPFLLEARDKANFISVLLVVLLMLVVIITMSYILILEKKETHKSTELEISNKLTVLYYELHKAEDDLNCFSDFAFLDSGDEDWVKDQKRYIDYLKQEIELLKTKL